MILTAYKNNQFYDNVIGGEHAYVVPASAADQYIESNSNAIAGDPKRKKYTYLFFFCIVQESLQTDYDSKRQFFGYKF